MHPARPAAPARSTLLPVRSLRTVRRLRRAGFTLLEVLLVLAILGVIAAMVVPQLLGRQQKASIDATHSSIHGLEQALKLYAVDHDGEFPQGGQEELEVLLNPVDRNGQAMSPYLDKLPTDAWGEMLYYRYPGTQSRSAMKPDIWSSGPNRQNEDGRGDDVYNWEETSI